MKLLICKLIKSRLGKRIFGNQKSYQKIANEKDELELESKVIGEVTLVPQEFLPRRSMNMAKKDLQE